MVMHLDKDIYEAIKYGTKNIEARVNDEKRRKVKIDDHITFLKRPDDIEKIDVIVKDLIYYKNFEDLIDDYTIEQLYIKGYSKEEFSHILKRSYSNDEVNKYGVVAIKFKVI